MNLVVTSGYKTVFGQNIKNGKDIVRKSSNLELADGHSGRLVSFSLPSPFPSPPAEARRVRAADRLLAVQLSFYSLTITRGMFHQSGIWSLAGLCICPSH